MILLIMRIQFKPRFLRHQAELVKMQVGSLVMPQAIGLPMPTHKPGCVSPNPDCFMMKTQLSRKVICNSSAAMEGSSLICCGTRNSLPPTVSVLGSLEKFGIVRPIILQTLSSNLLLVCCPLRVTLIMPVKMSFLSPEICKYLKKSSSFDWQPSLLFL